MVVQPADRHRLQEVVVVGAELRLQAGVVLEQRREELQRHTHYTLRDTHYTLRDTHYTLRHTLHTERHTHTTH